MILSFFKKSIENQGGVIFIVKNTYICIERGGSAFSKAVEINLLPQKVLTHITVVLSYHRDGLIAQLVRVGDS